MDLLPYSSRHWRANGRLVSLQLKEGGIIKRLSAFPDHANDETAFLDLMEQCAQRDIKRPSSYADFFYQCYTSPRLRWSVNALFYCYLAGGWEQARMTGILRGPHRKYDLNSAYFWSLAQGLPDPKSLRFSPKPRAYSDVQGFSSPGLYVISIEAPSWNWPYPFNTRRSFYIATTSEIEAYGLPVSCYHSGVTWSRTIDIDPMVSLVLSLPASKCVARSFWGRWASTNRVECCMSSGKRWMIRNPIINMVWAHLIVSRVKLHIWQAAVTAAHVFVDSIITDQELETGDALGDWRLVKEYPDGLEIHAPGVYGIPNQPLEKHAGRQA